VDEVKASVAVNLEAERRVSQLNEELQGLVRTLKQKEQHIQEAAVKNDLMERKMETVKRQADSIAEKDIVIADGKRRQRELEEALEQVQGDLDVSEQERLKLKTLVGNEQRQGSFICNYCICAIYSTFFQLPALSCRNRRIYLSKAVWRRRISSNRYDFSSRGKFTLTLPADRRSSWHSSVSPHRELVPQGSRPPARNRGIASAPRTYQPGCHTAA
jgi:hypothetical protein